MTLLIFEIVSHKTGAFLSPPFQPVRIISHEWSLTVIQPIMKMISSYVPGRLFVARYTLFNEMDTRPFAPIVAKMPPQIPKVGLGAILCPVSQPSISPERHRALQWVNMSITL